MAEIAKGSVPQSGRGAFSSGKNREITADNPGAVIENPETEAQNPAAVPENPGTEAQNPAAEAENPGTEAQNPAAEADNPETAPRNPRTEIWKPAAKSPPGMDAPPFRDGTEADTPASGTPALCPVCGGTAEGFGSFPIREGLLCGDCAGKLSEWFPCRPDTSAADIRRQLSYREENRTAARAFHTSKILWSQPCAALDTQSGTFQISSQRGRSANPDILSFRQLRGCQVEVAEQRRELFRSGREHYRPRRYEYRFEIFVRVLVDHPFFHEMRFRLHDKPVVVSDRMVQASTAGKVVKNPEYQRCKRAGEEICAALQKSMEQAAEEARRAADTGEAHLEADDTQSEGFVRQAEQAHSGRVHEGDG